MVFLTYSCSLYDNCCCCVTSESSPWAIASGLQTFDPRFVFLGAGHVMCPKHGIGLGLAATCILTPQVTVLMMVNLYQSMCNKNNIRGASQQHASHRCPKSWAVSAASTLCCPTDWLAQRRPCLLHGTG